MQLTFVPRILFLLDVTGLPAKQLEQGSANCGPWTRSVLSPVFINKVLLEHSQAHSLTYSQWFFPSRAAQLNSYDRNYMAQKPKIVTLGPFKEKFADLCPKRLTLYFIHVLKLHAWHIVHALSAFVCEEITHQYQMLF